MSASTFVRGQIWYYEDPICGKKDDGIEVPKNECIIRYNRYVIIIQNTETIAGSVLVIPCSSKNNSTNDIKIPISHSKYKDTSYAKCNSIFPVSTYSLTRYICTLSDEVMKTIEAELIKLLIPSNNSNNNDVFNVVNQLFESNTNISNNNKNKEAKSCSKNTWSEERKNVFIEACNNNPIDKVAEEYGISVKSARTYKCKWKTLKNIKETEDDLPDLTNLPKAISKISGMIKSSLRSFGMYYHIRNIAWKYESDMSEEDFYQLLGRVIYFSLLDFLSVMKLEGYNNFYIPNISKNTKHLDTYRFFDRIYNDDRIPRDVDGINTMVAYNKLYDNCNGINPEWLTAFEDRLKRKMNISATGIKAISNYIKTEYCDCE